MRGNKEGRKSLLEMKMGGNNGMKEGLQRL